MHWMYAKHTEQHTMKGGEHAVANGMHWMTGRGARHHTMRSVMSWEEAQGGGTSLHEEGSLEGCVAWGSGSDLGLGSRLRLAEG